MTQRGVTPEEIEAAVNEGWPAADAKAEVEGRVMVFPYHGEWGGEAYAEKEVILYYKYVNDRVVILTAKARYGDGFPRR